MPDGMTSILPNKVKMVIWDLDETFWKGTLSEGPITAIDANKKMVITLAERGIVSSVCSKNDHDAAAAALTDMGIWDYFVFPKIEWGPKGQNIAAIIDEANLRPDNVLFIDDNALNLQEAKHFSPGLMVADPIDILDDLLAQPEVAGKDDAALTRLNQYKNLEKKSLDRSKSTASNAEFLRDCDIRVEIDYEIEKEFDRVVELANRTNQLNFTKIRLETPAAIEAFRALCTSSFGITAGFVSVSDKYGDYGIVGYFVVHRKEGVNRLLHFAFSCRTMNMGIEQYVYERLLKPTIKVVGPIANPIQSFGKIDWISEGLGGDRKLSALNSDKKLVLIGGCELLQLSSMCSTRRQEFVNTIRGGNSIRYDDAGFILGNRWKIEHDYNLKLLKYWNFKDTQRFDRALAGSEIVLAALYGAAQWNYFAGSNGVHVRIVQHTLQKLLRTNGVWFVRNYSNVRMTIAERFALVAKALDRLAQGSRKQSQCFAFGVNARKIPVSGGKFLDQPESNLDADLLKAIESGSDAPFSPEMLDKIGYVPDWELIMRLAFNRFLRDYCGKRAKYTFVDVNALVDANDIQDADSATEICLPDHFTRRGYMSIATFIAETLKAKDGALPDSAPSAVEIAKPYAA